MKIKLTAFFFFLMFGSSLSSQAQNGSVTLSGRITNSDGVAVDYATVLLKSASDTLKVYGGISDEQGRFILKVPAGDYLFQTSFLGYSPLSKQITLVSSQDMGNLVMTPVSTELDAVVVRARMVKREADRFVVNVGNSPVAAGQTAKEMLDLSPTVWIDEERGISLNGKENVQVYVNERIVRESGEELIKYLYSIRAEDIVRIEVIPVGGVEHEASAQGGIIKLTLRKQRDDGLEGSLRMRYGTRLNDNPQQYIQPSLSINYRLAKFSLYTDITENRNKYYGYGIARRINKNGYSFESNWRQSSLKDSPTLRVGTIYDISPRHSVGVEANLARYFPEKERSSVVDTVFYNGALQGTIESDYNYLNKHKNWNLSANYIARFDTVGSTFKLLFDYVRTHPHTGGYVEVDHIIPGDAYTYRSNNESQNDLYSVTGDFDIRAGDNARVKTGFKYIFSQVDSWMKYEDLVGDIWVVRPDQTYDMVYDEHISAAYGRYTYTFDSKISVGVGLRVEHTYAMPAATGVNNIERQNYFSFFPQADLILPLGDSHQLIFNYVRKIRRPSFWLLIPLRRPISETEVAVGNPKLKPSFSHEFSLNWVIRQKYTVTAGAYLMNDVWVSTPRVDPDDPMSLIRTPENQNSSSMWYVSAAVPVQVTPWWSFNANLVGTLAWYHIDQYRKSNHRLTGNLINTFTLREGTSLMLSAYGHTRNRYEYTQYAGAYYINAGITQQLLKGAMTLSAQVNNIFDTRNSWRSVYNPYFFEESFFWGQRPMFVASVQYKFKNGKEFRARRVESDTDTSRISGREN